MYELEKEKESLQIQNRYNAILEACMMSLRATDHEYKNHLNTICTTLKSGTTEELRTVVNGYVRDIKDKDSLTKLIYVDNVILRAIIYNKIAEAEIVKVIMKYTVACNLNDKCIGDPDMDYRLGNIR